MTEVRKAILTQGTPLRLVVICNSRCAIFILDV